jgi:predicted transcriptional regulator
MNTRGRRGRSARVSRLIRLLRAHGLIRKETAARRYTVTPRGREIMTAILAAQTITLEQLRKTA